MLCGQLKAWLVLVVWTGAFSVSSFAKKANRDDLSHLNEYYIKDGKILRGKEAQAAREVDKLMVMELLRESPNHLRGEDLDLPQSDAPYYPGPNRHRLSRTQPAGQRYGDSLYTGRGAFQQPESEQPRVTVQGNDKGYPRGHSKGVVPTTPRPCPPIIVDPPPTTTEAPCFPVTSTTRPPCPTRAPYNPPCPRSSYVRPNYAQSSYHNSVGALDRMQQDAPIPTGDEVAQAVVLEEEQRVLSQDTDKNAKVAEMESEQGMEPEPEEYLEPAHKTSYLPSKILQQETPDWIQPGSAAGRRNRWKGGKARGRLALYHTFQKKTRKRDQ